jgi:hypothetical protein
VLWIRTRDPVPCGPLDPESGMGKKIRFPDPRWVKKSGSGSWMNNPDHISESLETIFWVKILKFFDADPGSGMEKIRIRDPEEKKFGSGINIPDPQDRNTGIYFSIKKRIFLFIKKNRVRHFGPPGSGSGTHLN